MNGYQDSTRWKRQELCQEVEASDVARQPCKTSRFNQLPRDILAEIFVQCLPEVRLWPVIDGRSTKDVAPLLLCNVCFTWRAVALATPRLWQTLFLVFEQAMPKSKVEEVIAMMHIWIGRSGVLPLTLSLCVEQLRVRQDIQALGKAVLNALFNYMSRWEHVGFSYLPIPPSQLEHMPCLRTLIVPTYEGAQFPFASCPNLARIRWHFKSAVSLAPLPWHQLTYICLDHSMPTQNIIFVIRSCPKLTDLDITLEDEVQESLPREVVVNKSLRKLQFYTFQTCNQLFKRLALPALTDITIQFLSNFIVSMTRGFQKELLGFFSRSKCKLNRMDLDDCGLDNVELLECFRHDSCTALMDLRISNAYNSPVFTDSVLLALTDKRPRENNLLLPKLAYLSLASCLGGSPSRLGTMILSRCISQDKAVRLQHLNVYCQDLEEGDIILLELAQIQGLEVSLEFYAEDE
ncbi:hypothetical protein F5887DRAFT_1278040 [Amanita rubescens]|nr:hypothetical protein F5887DRAFT_1278040 [Amanita rubescens]